MQLLPTSTLGSYQLSSSQARLYYFEEHDLTLIYYENTKRYDLFRRNATLLEVMSRFDQTLLIAVYTDHYSILNKYSFFNRLVFFPMIQWWCIICLLVVLYWWCLTLLYIYSTSHLAHFALAMSLGKSHIDSWKKWTLTDALIIFIFTIGIYRRRSNWTMALAAVIIKNSFKQMALWTGYNTWQQLFMHFL
jgi:hypothetical protein